MIGVSVTNTLKWEFDLFCVCFLHVFVFDKHIGDRNLFNKLPNWPTSAELANLINEYQSTNLKPNWTNKRYRRTKKNADSLEGYLQL